MGTTAVCEMVRKHIIKNFGDKMSAVDLLSLLETAETIINLCKIYTNENRPDDTIIIRINPEKFNAEMLMNIEDDWINYITNDKGLDPSDAVMITPF